MHLPKHFQHQDAISPQGDRASDVASVGNSSAAPLVVTLSAGEPSSEEKSQSEAVPNSVSEDPKNLSYKRTHVKMSQNEKPMTSSLDAKVSVFDRTSKDFIGGFSKSNENFSNSTTTEMTSSSTTIAAVMLPQHDEGNDQESRDESSMRHDSSSSSESEEESSEDDVQSRMFAAKQKVSSQSRSTRKAPLTLSAFRRPEQTVRMTDSDPSRSLSAEYDLHSSQCRILGHGASSTVRLAIRRCDEMKVAVKRIAKHDALRRRRARKGNRRHLDEWEILQNLSGRPGIVSLLDLFETDDEIQMVMEYCQGGELFDAIQKRSARCRSSRRGSYSETQAARITSQILSALSDMHSRGIVHRDVKPENVLLMNEDETDLDVKLSDFGLARVLVNHDDSDSSGSDGDASPFTPPPCRSRAYSCVGTDFYTAPEVWAGEGYGTAVDVYSLGVTLYVLLCGFPPSYTSDFSSSGTEDSDSEEELISVNFPKSHWKDVSQEAKELIQKMLHPDPSKRITAHAALKDTWVVENSRLQDSPVQSSHIAPLVASRPVLDLELVRNRLYKKLNHDSRKRSHSFKSRSKKRRRVERRANSGLMAAAMADLYMGVASAAASASAAAAGVVYDEFEEGVKIIDEAPVEGVEDDSIVSSQFAMRALSV